jgi:hypothetical protein
MLINQNRFDHTMMCAKHPNTHWKVRTWLYTRAWFGIDTKTRAVRNLPTLFSLPTETGRWSWFGVGTDESNARHGTARFDRELGGTVVIRSRRRTNDDSTGVNKQQQMVEHVVR